MRYAGGETSKRQKMFCIRFITLLSMEHSELKRVRSTNLFLVFIKLTKLLSINASVKFNPNYFCSALVTMSK